MKPTNRNNSQTVPQIQPPKIAMLSTGEEVLFGDIVDTNASWLSTYLFENGFQMTSRLTVGDSLLAISNALTELCKTHDIIIVNGGLGPTSDDKTAEAAAMAAGTSLQLQPLWVERMQQMFDGWGRVMAPSNIKQAMLPENSLLLDNPRGTACGFNTNINGASCYFTPGVPHEFKVMVKEQILPHMQKLHSSVLQKHIHRIHTFGLTESGIANQLQSMSLPEGVSLGYRSALPFIEVKVFYSELTSPVRELLHRIETELASHTIAINEDVRDSTLALLKNKELSLTLFDCSTQGYLHQWLSEAASIHQVPINSVAINRQPDETQEQDELARLVALYSQFSFEKHQCNEMIISDVADGGVRLSVFSEDKISTQQFVFKRQYSFSARRVVISAIAIDMLRRHLQHRDICVDYGSVTRVSSCITTP
ncbi:molybdopterin-binding protein [Vibrio rarus]|uniref:molybdopterin-binding protein n=1 Tax=Vibrio rarus TaxID=413403 RepID=UPI0021C39A0F|nr:molybdopterin-binding protein [Vibrio rarus]